MHVHLAPTNLEWQAHIKTTKNLAFILPYCIKAVHSTCITLDVSIDGFSLLTIDVESNHKIIFAENKVPTALDVERFTVLGFVPNFKKKKIMQSVACVLRYF